MESNPPKLVINEVSVWVFHIFVNVQTIMLAFLWFKKFAVATLQTIQQLPVFGKGIKVAQLNESYFQTEYMELQRSKSPTRKARPPG